MARKAYLRNLFSGQKADSILEVSKSANYLKSDNDQVNVE